MNSSEVIGEQLDSFRPASLLRATHVDRALGHLAEKLAELSDILLTPLTELPPAPDLPVPQTHPVKPDNA